MTGVPGFTNSKKAEKVGESHFDPSSTLTAVPNGTFTVIPHRAIWGNESAQACFDEAVDALKPSLFPTERPPEGCTVKPTSAPDVSLIGLPNSFFDAKASYEENVDKLRRTGIPRFEKLSPKERAYETQFAESVTADPALYIEGVELLARNERLNTSIYEVDAAKRLFPPYGDGCKPASSDEREIRAESNHALHPTATALERLAFLKKLDALAQLEDGDPQKRVFVTGGGCAVGKGSLTDVVKRLQGKMSFGAVWDAAGEGDAKESAWILDACMSRGIEVVFGFAANDPRKTFRAVLERGLIGGRIVDVVTFAKSYVNGTAEMDAFLRSDAFQSAKRLGKATAVGVHVGDFNVASLRDNTLAPYPDLKLLGNDGFINGGDIPPSLGMAEIIESSLFELKQFVAERKTVDNDLLHVVNGALGLALKFRSEIP